MNGSWIVRRRRAGESSPSRRRFRRIRAAAGVLALLGVLACAASALGSTHGQRVWIARTGTASSPASAWDVATGPGGKSAMAGWATVGSNDVIYTAVYDAGGTQLWSDTYTAGTGFAEAVTFDSAGDVFVAGEVDFGGGDGRDLVLIKYDAAGVFQWAQSYDGPAHLAEQAMAVAVDGSNDIVIDGFSQVSSDLTGTVVIKYDQDGNTVWAAPARFDPDTGDPNAGSDLAYTLALDPSGNVYVAGKSYYQVSGTWVPSPLTLKFAAADGSRLWGQVYTRAGASGATIEAIALRGARVVGVGWIAPETPFAKALAVSYDLSGHEKHHWVFNPGKKLGTWFGDVALDSHGNVFVTGDQWQPTMKGYDEVLTMKLTPALSKVLWKGTYLPKTRGAEGWYLALDGADNVYVGGYADNAAKHESFLTMKYRANGTRAWSKTWSDGGTDDNEMNGLAPDTSGGIIVGGQGSAPGGFAQAVLLKYRR